MRNKFQLRLILLTIIIILFPSICFSELKTIQGEYCDVYLGDMKNKNKYDELRKYVRQKSIENGIRNSDKTYDFTFTQECMTDIINQYLEKVVIVSHTERGRKICDEIKITFETEVINKYIDSFIILRNNSYVYRGSCRFSPFYDLIPPPLWSPDINDVLTKKSDKINIGLIIEIKIQFKDEHNREQLESDQEQQFYSMIEKNRDKYRLIDRRHLKTILEEQKLSMTGLTDSETVKLGKLLNMDIIVLRIIYENSMVTKVMKVDTGEVLLFKTYEIPTKEGRKYLGEIEYLE